MTHNNSNDQEIDLSQLPQKLKKLFNNILDSFFDGFIFIKKIFLYLQY